jgi:hypothetical protein
LKLRRRRFGSSVDHGDRAAETDQKPLLAAVLAAALAAVEGQLTQKSKLPAVTDDLSGVCRCRTMAQLRLRLRLDPLYKAANAGLERRTRQRSTSCRSSN